MVLLKKVTLQYNQTEDRICMMSQPEGGQPLVFWLTLRMCRPLVQTLCGHLERTAPDKQVIDREMLLSCKQHEAEWQHESSDPVKAEAATGMFLPNRIDFSFSPQVAALMFPVGDKDRAELRMTIQELRQWLGIMHRLFRAAQWPMDMWPAWFSSGPPARN